MPKWDLRIDSGEYAPVADRIALFYDQHPTGRIVTQLVERSAEVIVFRALVYRSADEARPAATGWASERVGDGDINSVACLENTETSAIGRALANLGFAASGQRPSLEEMQKAARERMRLAARVSEPRAGRTRQPSAGTRPSAGPSPSGAPSTEPPSDRPESPQDVLLRDTLDLLAEAERAGLAAERVTRLRARLLSGRTTPLGLERAETALRRWLAAPPEGRDGIV